VTAGPPLKQVAGDHISQKNRSRVTATDSDRARVRTSCLPQSPRHTYAIGGEGLGAFLAPGLSGLWDARKLWHLLAPSRGCGAVLPFLNPNCKAAWAQTPRPATNRLETRAFWRRP